MIRIGDPAQRNWENIGQNLLLAAAEAVAEAAQRRANARPDAVQIEHESQDKLIVRISDKALILREQGDATTPPRSFLSPSAQDRRGVRHIILQRLSEEIA